MKKISNKEVAFKPNTVATENLPYPAVLYPGHYGSFFVFKKDERDEQSEACFCSCAYEAIENYIKLRLLSPVPQNADPTRMFILDSFHFPKLLVEHLIQKNLTPENILSALNFEEKLCHECNLQTPDYRYCHEMYGGTFKQNYGWYINKQGYEWGINLLSLQFLPDRCPQEVLDEIKIKPPQGGSGWFDVLQGKNEEDEKIIKQFRKQNRRIRNIVENEVRRKFGHKKVGEAWTSETILYYIVKKLFLHYTIHRHYRPEFLKGLELDIFIEEARIGIEYQGIQHYKPIKYWGGKEALEKVRKRDKKKKRLCSVEKISLVYFDYHEGLSDDLVLAKLKPLM